ncbi:MAG: hypothetical protein AAF384_13155, partial [Pseudomonadota bacterium]
WQKEQIHKHGRRYTPQSLCEKVTQSPLSEEYCINYRRRKYGTEQAKFITGTGLLVDGGQATGLLD